MAGPGTTPDAGIDGLLGSTAAPPARTSPVPPAGPGGARRRPVALLVAAAVLIAALVGVGGFLLLRDPDGGDDTTPAAATTDPATPTPATADPESGDTEVLDGFRYTLQTGRVDDSCSGRAYGAVADYFERSDCAGLSRALWTAETEGGWAIVSLARVTMPDAASARALQGLADTDGSGNVSDLLREGVRVDGAPEKLSRAEYASGQDGPVVTIVETAWIDADARGGAKTLDTLAEAALDLPAAGGPDVPVD